LLLAAFQKLTVYTEGISTLMGKCKVHGSNFIGVGWGGGGRGAEFLLKQIRNSFRKRLLLYENFGVHFVLKFISTKLRMGFQIIVNFCLQYKRWVNELLLNIRKQMNKIRQKYSNILIRHLLHVSPFAVASTRILLLLKTIV
jgi:hypothetical protein